MCGRLANLVPVEAMARLFGASPGNDLPHVPNFNICPTTEIAVVTSNGTADDRRLRAMRWGFIPAWYKRPGDGPLLINARSETIATKPAFSAAVRARRCLIPVSGFYEWQRDHDGTRRPWYFHRQDGSPVTFAGIWQTWESSEEGTGKMQLINSCAIVTCSANAPCSVVHHRMPVILEAGDWAKWLGEEGHGAAPLMRPAESDVIGLYRVATTVNSNRASGPELIEEIDA